jgi:hypothetical protein
MLPSTYVLQLASHMDYCKQTNSLHKLIEEKDIQKGEAIKKVSHLYMDGILESCVSVLEIKLNNY